MFHSTRPLRAFVLALAVGLAVSTAASAETYRIPKTGGPALAVDAPPGWTASYDQYDNLQFFASDHSAAVQLSMISDPRVKTTTAPELAAQVFQAAGSQSQPRPEPGSIAGRTGEAFTGILPINGAALNMKVVIVKLDASHAATLSTLTKNTMTTAQTAAVDQMVARVRIVGQ